MNNLYFYERIVHKSVFSMIGCFEVDSLLLQYVSYIYGPFLARRNKNNIIDLKKTVDKKS